VTKATTPWHDRKGQPVGHQRIQDAATDQLVGEQPHGPPAGRHHSADHCAVAQSKIEEQLRRHDPSAEPPRENPRFDSGNAHLPQHLTLPNEVPIRNISQPGHSWNAGPLPQVGIE
jgi:hypothetical protein